MYIKQIAIRQRAIPELPSRRPIGIGADRPLSCTKVVRLHTPRTGEMKTPLRYFIERLSDLKTGPHMGWPASAGVNSN